MVEARDIAGTALTMREINLSLKENLLVGRVIIIADTGQPSMQALL